MKGFQGISLYLLEESDYTKLLAIPLEFWEWLVQNDWLVSVNSFGALWGPWKVVLKKQPLLKMIVSHLGLPGRQTEIPSREEVKSLMKPISELAEFSNVHVKLSGYYALTSPAHDFPHSSAWPLTEELCDHFVQKDFYGEVIFLLVLIFSLFLKPLNFSIKCLFFVRRT